MKMWNCSQKGDRVGLSFWVWEGVCFLWEAFPTADLMVEPPEAQFESQIFRFSIVHRFWSVEEFWDPLKPGDNDFHPQGHHRGPPPYWPLHCCPVVVPAFLLPDSDWFNKTPKNPSGVKVSFLSVDLFLLAAFFWLKSGLIKDNPVLSCGQIILTPF